MAILELSMITGAIVEMSVEAAANSLGRQETVIRILKRLGLDHQPEPNDFDAIYAHTLIEYGVFKPEAVLNFFRNQYIRDAFREAFYDHDPLILEREAEGIIEWNNETKKLGQLPYDFKPRIEFASFSAVFNQLVDEIRTPSQVKRDYAIETLHIKSEQILQRLARLDGLDEIRLELARLLPQDDRRTHLSKLQAGMRGWFKTINYQFESHEIYEEDYFEWIVNVPVRRNRYERIIVRGITGEVGIKDVKDLQQVVKTQNVDEGWVVSVRRVSPAANALAQSTKVIFCYTFDELLDEHVDFTRYFEWLEKQVKQHRIDSEYVPLAATKDEFDPLSQQILGTSKYDEANGWLESYIDQWLDDPAKEHVSILGEFGTGKTWFSLHYAWLALNKYLEAKARKVSRPRLPIYIPLRDYAKAVSVESLFSEFFFRKHEIPMPGYSTFEQLNKMGKFLLIFDGFDEMASRIDRQQMINNFWELTRIVVPGSKAILTCRTEYFPTAQESRDLLSAKLKASTSNLSGMPPQFEVLKLEKLNENQISQLLSYRTTEKVKQQILKNSILMDLAQRPVLIEFILGALPDIESGKPVDMSRVYLYAIQNKMERDIRSERTFTSMADKLYFMCELAWEMMATDQLSLNYRHFPDRLRKYFGEAIASDVDLDHWHYDMMGQTLLIRDSEGNYSPAHRSLLEWFVAYKYCAELGILDSDFLSLAHFHSYADSLSGPEDYTWHDYFLKRHHNTKTLPPLKKFKGRSKEAKPELLFAAPKLNFAIAQFMGEMVSEEFIDSLPSISQDQVIRRAFEQLSSFLERIISAPAVTNVVELPIVALRSLANFLECKTASITIVIGNEAVPWLFLPSIDLHLLYRDSKLDTFVSYVIKNARPVNLQMAKTAHEQVISHLPIGSMILLPINVNKKAFGILSITTTKVYESEEVLSFLETVCRLFWSTLFASMAGIQEFWRLSKPNERYFLIPLLIDFDMSTEVLREMLDKLDDVYLALTDDHVQFMIDRRNTITDKQLQPDIVKPNNTHT